MKILKIALKNLNSLKLETVIDFTTRPLLEAGLFSIVGDTGAGKTTILDAMTLGMYGKMHRNNEEGEVLSYGTVDGYAEVEFSTVDAIYRGRWVVHRARGKLDGNLLIKRELAQWNAEKAIFEILTTKKREINEKVETITGLDYERFCKSVLLSQGDFAAFLKAGDKERSNLLERITGTEVYSQISIAAFRKHKLEEQKLADLKRELEALQILDKETVNSFKADVKALTKESKEQQKIVNTCQNQITWRNSLFDLENQKVEFGLGVANATAQMEAATVDFEKLTKHQTTIVFQKDLTRLEGLEVTQKTLESEGEELQENLVKYQTNEKELADKSKEITIHFKALKKEEVEKEKLFKKVDSLDIKIQEKQIPLEGILKEQLEIDNQLVDNQLNVKKYIGKEENAKKLVKEINEWLVTNQSFKNLEGALPALRSFLSDWTNQTEEEKAIQKEQEQTQLALGKAKDFINNFEKNLSSQSLVLEQSIQLFFSNFSDTDSKDRGELLEQLNVEIDELNNQGKSLHSLIELNEDYLELIQELTKYDDEIFELENRRGMIEVRLLSAVELEEELKKVYDFKLQMFEREKLFANYDRERATLEEGEKCPLCLSTSHPFRILENYKPYVNEAEAEFLAIKGQLDIVTKDRQKRINEQNDINNQIFQIIGEQEKNMDGKRDLILKRIKTAESKIALIAPELNDQNLYNTTKGSILKQKLITVKEKIIAKRKLRNELLQLDQEITKKERALVTLRQSDTSKQINLSKLQNDEKNIAQKLAVIQKKNTALKQKIDKELAPFNFSLADQTEAEILNALEENRSKFESENARLIKGDSYLLVTAQKLKQLRQQEKELTKRAEKINKQVEKAKAELADLQQNRKELFGEQTVEIIRNNFKSQLTVTEDNAAGIQEALKAAEILLKSTTTAEKKNKQDLTKVNTELDKQSTALLAKIQSKGFENIEVLKIANLSPKEVEQLESLKANLEKKLTQRQQDLAKITKDLATTLAKELTTETLETLEVKHSEATEQFQQLQQQIGKITQQIEDNDRRQKEGKDLVEKMDIQQKEFRRWAKLKEIIGSADGKVFRAFAQGLTLKKLSELANKHLLQLNGRYLIHKPNDKDLALEIIDQHHANNIRSIHTLSGGESFLVSLALALGLSDLAGRNTQIKSLFIDEGFGTLDESALDLAISTLENLQSKGKTIGVISHVNALKERITTQIQVQKKGSGFSDVLVVG